jgi:hypothetical protein
MDCPADAMLASGAPCRSAAGLCDVAESCSGSSDDCPADGFAPAGTVCRSSTGICDPQEECTGSSGTCPANVPATDSDGDAVCDAQDKCDDDSNPGQADGDADSIGDVCDPCSNVRNVFARKSKLTITKLLTPPGDDKLKLKGEFTLPPVPGDPPVDPVMEGVRAIIVDSTDGEVLDVTIPPGMYDPRTRSGWKVNSSATSFTYVNSGAVTPLPQGIKKFGLKRSTNVAGLIRFSVSGKSGSYAVNLSNLPLRGTLVLDMPVATTGLCSEVPFPGPSNPAATCAATSGNNTIRCK